MFDINNCSGINEIDIKIDPDKEYNYEGITIITEDANIEDYETIEHLLEKGRVKEAFVYLEQWYYPGEHMVYTHKIHVKGEYYIKNNFILNIDKDLGRINFICVLGKGE